MEYTPKYSYNTKQPRRNILDEADEPAEEIGNNSLDEEEFFEKSDDTPIIERPQAEPAPSSSKGMFHHLNP